MKERLYSETSGDPLETRSITTLISNGFFIVVLNIYMTAERVFNSMVFCKQRVIYQVMSVRYNC